MIIVKHYVIVNAYYSKYAAKNVSPQTQCTPTWQCTKGSQFISKDQQPSLAAVCESKDSIHH